MKKQLLTFSIFLIGISISAQVKITKSPLTADTIDPSAMLEVESTDMGTLIPRLTTSERDLISSPSNGLLIFNKDTGCLNQYHDGSGNLNIAGWNAICGTLSTALLNKKIQYEILTIQN
ncbi:hypothetical protein [Epilithonimonas sp. UC225_85]|uniref:hypothetical protein n=1 Tax=Epilithonimonas sp. UC225_85 TaxID=3350167 RepID=UPI0036D2DCE6